MDVALTSARLTYIFLAPLSSTWELTAGTSWLAVARYHQSPRSPHPWY
jgi:hypothetical protein